MSAVYVDTSVLLLAVGDPAPDRDAARAFVAGMESGRELHASVEVAQEFLFHRMRRAGREVALTQTDELVRTLVLHPFGLGVLDRSMALVRTTSIRGRDAVHAATALHVGLDTLVTYDRDFAEVPGLRVARP